MDNLGLYSNPKSNKHNGVPRGSQELPLQHCATGSTIAGYCSMPDHLYKGKKDTTNGAAFWTCDLSVCAPGRGSCYAPRPSRENYVSTIALG